MFYGKVIRRASDTTMRYENGTPYNFTVVGFETKRMRDECTDAAWDEGGNVIHVRRRDLFSRDLPCPCFASVDVFREAYRDNFEYEAIRSRFVNTEYASLELQEAMESCTSAA